MSLDPSRMRAVSSTSTAAPLDDEIATLVNDLKALDLSTWQAYKDDLAQAGLLQQLRYKLKDTDAPTNPQDSFRRAQGFQVLIKSVRNLVEVWCESHTASETVNMIQTLSQFLLVLEAALVHHAGNNRYFRTKVEAGGWSGMQQYLLTLLNTYMQGKPEKTVLEQFYGILLAAAVGDEGLSAIFTSTAKSCPPPGRSWDLKSADLVQVQIKRQLQNVTDIAVPDLLTIMLKTWTEYLNRTGKSIQTINLAFPISLKVLMSISRQNIVEAHTAGLLSAVTPLLFDGQHTLVEKSLYRELALLLFQEGVTNLDDAHFFFSKASASAAAASFLLEAIRVSRQPACIQFDLSRYGSSSIELPTLRKVFPPTDSDGYTISMWARFDSFDPDAHTTLFGTCDKSQTCFVLAYLEKDSRHLILQTAIKGSRPSVRFKSTKFETEKWYHICIVHKKPRVTSSSKALFFVNGLFVEQVKANFPMTPPTDRSGSAKVQAFLGTPQDLAPNTDGTCTSMWSLASAVLFQITLNEDLIAVIFHLGPTYHGNMQDCLGSFQTYDASAALNFRNESLNAGNEHSSQLSLAIRQKGSSVLPEDTILLNISPAAVLDNDDRNNIDESQLIRSLSKIAAKNLFSYTRAGANAVVVNGAVPAINDALVQSNGVAMLMGEPVVTVPQSMEDVSWRLGGCAPIGLSLIAKARTTEEVAIAVDILLETVKNSWRNSEVMERNNGYNILSSLLRDKLVMPHSNTNDQGKSAVAIPTPSLDRSGLALKLLKSILSFLGFDYEDTSKSMINNPLAYKVLLVDNSVWRNHHFETQEFYFRQFVVFAKESVHMKFNLKRLSRMRALRRLLEALKSENVSRSTMPSYSAALCALLPTAMSAEMLRSIALFITYSVHKRNITGRLRRSVRSRASSGAGSVTPTGDSPNLSQFEIGVEVLRLYSNMLCTKGDLTMIKKFARTVTNKWLLYLLSETSPEVIVLSMRILARLLVVHGEAYVKKFKDKSGGFAIVAHRLKRWWHLPALWPACFAILFDVDVAELDLDRSFDLFSFVDLFNSKQEYGIVYPEMFEVITGMLQSGLKTIVSSKEYQPGLHVQGTVPTSNIPERLSMSTMAPPNPLLTLATSQNIDTFNTIVRFLSDLQTRSAKFREYASSSSYVQELLFVLFPVVVGADVVEAAVELNARDSMLSFDGTDVVVQPLSARPPIIRAARKGQEDKSSRGKMLRRGSSFVLVSKDLPRQNESHETITTSADSVVSPTRDAENNVKHSIVQSILEIVVSLFVDQLLTRKDFVGLGLFLKTPPGFVEHQTFFESWILRNTISQLSNAIALDQTVLCETKVLTNLARFLSHLGDAIFEGWFLGGSESVIDLASTVLEYLQRSDVSKLKTVRLCAQPISIIRAVIFRVQLLSFSHLETGEMLAFLKKLSYWQNVLLSPEEAQSTYLQLLCYLLYGSLISHEQAVRIAAADLWRTILVQKPNETAAILGQASTTDQKQLASSFEKLVELDNESFLVWIDEHRSELDSLFFGTLSKSWDAFVVEENAKTEESGKARISRRKEKLKTWSKEEMDREELLRRHDVTFDHWTTNIHSSETLKHQRLIQDQQDDLVYNNMTFARIQRELSRSTGLFSDEQSRKWRVDQTEGRNRMRKRLIEDYAAAGDDSQPKRKGSEVPALRLDTKGLKASTIDSIGATPVGDVSIVQSPHPTDSAAEPFPDVPERSDTLENMETEESFELVEDPNAGQEDFEDKNRKVMRSLHRGDQVKHVANISRIAGLEAVEGLLILGKDHIYLIDNFFQRADGEIMHVWQAPPEERDAYVGMISGRDISTRKPAPKDDEHETRSWKWAEVISISKRRFLFRDVAIEIFFGDGRSYLLTVLNSKVRNDLYSLVNAKAPQYGNPDSPQSEVAWRYETLKSAEDEPQTFGARFASVFAQSPSLTATRKWQKGEMSNFHYLMLINTLAGRTYNDLTQYPVFPWVIADYTSEELDLENPLSFRDFSKPMGCQHPDRESEFRERYKQFAEMGDSSAPPFHYGTHYSSAMIVTSYLIRLQPFVKSYLLLQGGTFDHPDRLFYSVEGAWKSASQTNMTDVRELTPEFFYLPEFLTNPNNYDFGMRQNSTKSIGNVALPPWAKGDPKIFIAKQREALESPYVSKHLHKWIDLVFGCKQKGDAAVDAVNVFHHLSYQGARDLDAIDDPIERLATIGIIHNFGQTPHQVFQRAHPGREHARHKYKRLDSAAESLTRIPGTLLDSEERVASLTYALKADKLLCSGAFRLNIPPAYDKYMEWGFSDNSIRFYSADSRKQIGLFEHLHVGQLSCALFGDSKTLITAGTDCTVAVWSIQTLNSKTIDVQPRATLFGHRATVTNLALSRSFNALLSCSSNGELILWDLNRCEFVRRIAVPGSIPVECVTINDVTGNIFVCHGPWITVFTLNGEILVSQDTSERSAAEDNIICVACYEGAGTEWLERDILFTGHKRGIAKVWSLVINSEQGGWELELIRVLNHIDSSREDGGNFMAGISCILPLPQVVYTGDEDGRVCEWNCVQRH
ncbi:beige protein-like 1 [Neophaeococcomyces mojaviensis]|uniref:Beige protein-like 1 n=1 Tax=Neophaeococcomyces mojaviensis TaxID=3383035 RepID=A0ACC3AEE6_9EURO|nr:beige protein-like 1 [Knufia sp. JES_112]